MKTLYNVLIYFYSEDDSRSKGKDIQRINSFQSGKSVDSGLPDIHETNEEDMAAKQGDILKFFSCRQDFARLFDEKQRSGSKICFVCSSG